MLKLYSIKYKSCYMLPINMKEDIHALSDFRAGVSSYIQQVSKTKRPLVITQHGKGVAVLTSINEFESMQTRLELLEDLYKAEKQIEEGQGIAHDKAQTMVMKGLDF